MEEFADIGTLGQVACWELRNAKKYQKDPNGSLLLSHSFPMLSILLQVFIPTLDTPFNITCLFVQTQLLWDRGKFSVVRDVAITLCIEHQKTRRRKVSEKG